jgi:hypothetical protein
MRGPFRTAPAPPGTSHDGRLDPVRWRRPGRNLLLRLLAVAVLLVAAAAMSWSRPRSCASLTATPPTGGAGGRPPDAAPQQSSGPEFAGETPVPAGRVGVPVRLADPAALSLVRPGNLVDLLRLDDPGGHATAVASAAPVLGVSGATDPTAGGLLLALTPDEAQHAVAAPGRGFAVLIRPG